jgi:hypothetical protein
MSTYKRIIKIWNEGSTILFKGIVIIFLLLCMCKYTTAPEDHDLLEIERMWQYMSAYSIYQDRIPGESAALSFPTPGSLVLSIYDTMRSWADPTSSSTVYYGRYYPDGKVLEDEISGVRKEVYNPEIFDPVFFEELTLSTAYILIPEFGRNTYNEMNALTGTIEGYPNLIIDLRDNHGGFIDICQDIIELFLYKNTKYLYVEYRTDISANGNYATVEENWLTENDDSGWEGKKIVILINSESASAAEIMTVALRDGCESNQIRIFGENLNGKGNSYGKAIGQYIFLFYATSGAGLKLTGFRFKGTSGIDDKDNYHEKGIEPDSTIPNAQLVPEALNWLESDHKNTIDSTAFRGIINYASKKRKSLYKGCYKIIDLKEIVF